MPHNFSQIYENHSGTYTYALLNVIIASVNE